MSLLDQILFHCSDHFCRYGNEILTSYFYQTLNREPLPNLEKFHATIFVIQNLPTKEELEEQLCDFNLTVKEDDEGDEDCDMEDADLEFTIDSCCRVVLRKGMYIDVLYYKTS